MNWKKVLPGVSYLEMAQEAIKQATQGLLHDEQRLHLTNIVWAKPVVVGEKFETVHIALHPDEDGSIRYEVYTNDQNQENAIVHSQGCAQFYPVSDTESLDINSRLAACQAESISPVECYGIFTAMGIEYGPAHKGVKDIYIGDREIFAKIYLPSFVANTQAQFTLHQSLMDSALQL